MSHAAAPCEGWVAEAFATLPSQTAGQASACLSSGWSYAEGAGAESLRRERVAAKRAHRQLILSRWKPVAQFLPGIGQRPSAHRVPVVNEHPTVVGQKDRDVEPVVVGDHPTCDVSSRILMRTAEGFAQPTILRVDVCAPPWWPPSEERLRLNVEAFTGPTARKRRISHDPGATS